MDGILDELSDGRVWCGYRCVLYRVVLWASNRLCVDCFIPGSTYRIPVPGFPDIIVTTFLSPRPANTTTFNEDISLAAAPISISGAVCNTTCSGTAGTGPNQFDCTTIANSLRSNGATTVTLSPFLVTQFAFRSCKIFVSNQNATETIV